MSNTRTLRKGDIIKGHRTLEVSHVGDSGVVLEDVQNGRKFFNFHDTVDSWHYEVVRLAAPAKPKVGDVLSGSEINRTPLKRGTVVVGATEHPLAGHTFVLTSAGDWYGPAKHGVPDERDEYFPELGWHVSYRFVHVA